MHFFLLLTLLWLGASESDGRTDDGNSNLRAAAARVDITPALGTPLAGYGDRESGATGVRDPLRAGVIILDDGDTRAAIVTLDLINVGDAETRLIRKRLEAQTGIAFDHVLVSASHTHGGPHFRADTDYARDVAEKIAEAAAEAMLELRAVTLGYGAGTSTSCVNRRVLNEEGVAEMRPNPDGPMDARVRVLRFDDSTGAPAAMLIHAACHANVFRDENLEITADYPGLVQSFVERTFDGAPALFLAGAGANVRPNLPSEGGGFRSGDDADLTWVGLDIGAAAIQAAARAGNRESVAEREAMYDITSHVAEVALPGKNGDSLSVEIQALRVGNTLFLTIPGEPFVQYATQVEQALSPEVRLLVVGYANGHHGYFCTSESYEHAGYEPGVSKLAPEAEPILVSELIRLARTVL